MRSLGTVAHVDADAIQNKEGIVSGKFSIPDSVLTGSFSAESGTYQLEIDRPRSRALDQPFLSQQTIVWFKTAGGAATDMSYVVQFHPDTRVEPQLEPGEEKYVGYGVTLASGATSLQPLTMMRGPERGSWRIGHGVTLQKTEQGALDRSPCDVWLRLLEPLMR